MPPADPVLLVSAQSASRPGRSLSGPVVVCRCPFRPTPVVRRSPSPGALRFSTSNPQERHNHEHCDHHRPLTADPELRFTSGTGQAVATVRVAINEQGRDKAVFIDLESWEKTAEFICEYGTKGRLFEATARLALDQWTDAEGGQHSKHYLVTGPYQFRFLDKASATDEPEALAEDG